MVAIPNTKDAYRLIMEGSRALTDVEQNGMLIDVPYLKGAVETVGQEIKDLGNSLRQDEVYVLWRKMFGEKSNLGSRPQLAKVIYDGLGIEPVRHTGIAKRGATDVNSLLGVDVPFIAQWNRLEKTKKIQTFLERILHEVSPNSLLHNFIHLHLVTTYRSSASDFNIQQVPARDGEAAKLIRSAFIPRPGRVLIELDYGSLEFSGAGIFWTDPAMVAYASDPTLDIHRDTAAEVYKMPINEVTKSARTYAKTYFVFPILYGAYYGTCAPNLWNQIEKAKLQTKSEVPLYDYLESKGISGLGNKRKPQPGSYFHHIKGCEENFNNRFSYWSSQKEVWWNDYLRHGWFPIQTGFVCQGVYSYNNLMNTPIQGMCFHFLLWSLIGIIKEIKRRKMKTLVIAEVHDSIFADVPEDEVEDYVNMAREIMTEKIRQHWPWIIVPLKVEPEICRENWYGKEVLAI